MVMQETHDYIDEATTVANATTHTWIHPLSDITAVRLTDNRRL